PRRPRACRSALGLDRGRGGANLPRSMAGLPPVLRRTGRRRGESGVRARSKLGQGPHPRRGRHPRARALRPRLSKPEPAPIEPGYADRVVLFPIAALWLAFVVLWALRQTLEPSDGPWRPWRQRARGPREGPHDRPDRGGPARRPGPSRRQAEHRNRSTAG